jgi:membrane-bound serine protease (ClpP class)
MAYLMRLSGRPFAALLAGLVAAAAPARAEIPVVELDGVVHAISAAHIIQVIERAETAQAPLVVIRMDTPGGLISSMKQIVEKMLASKVPVAVFVGPSGSSGTSAGFVITIAGDVAAMAPGTNIGAAHPVSSMGPMDEVMSKKAASDMAAYVRSKAEPRGRTPEIAEKAVLESKSFTEREALEAKLIDLVVKDIDELIDTLDGRKVKRFDGSEVVLKLKGHLTLPIKMSWRESLLSLIASPEILFLLLLGALAGLGSEISHPGLIFPGVLGTVCLILFLMASQVLPVNAAGILLIVLAIALFVAEVKVTSYGLLTVGGIVAMILGAMMLVDAPLRELQVPLSLVVPAALITAMWSLGIVSLALRTRRVPIATGGEGMIGAVAVAETDLAPEGWVWVKGARWRAVADAPPVAAGQRVHVTGLSGLTLTVKKEA